MQKAIDGVWCVVCRCGVLEFFDAPTTEEDTVSLWNTGFTVKQLAQREARKHKQKKGQTNGKRTKSSKPDRKSRSRSRTKKRG